MSRGPRRNLDYLIPSGENHLITGYSCVDGNVRGRGVYGWVRIDGGATVCRNTVDCSAANCRFARADRNVRATVGTTMELLPLIGSISRTPAVCLVEISVSERAYFIRGTYMF